MGKDWLPDGIIGFSLNPDCLCLVSGKCDDDKALVTVCPVHTTLSATFKLCLMPHVTLQCLVKTPYNSR